VSVSAIPLFFQIVLFIFSDSNPRTKKKNKVAIKPRTVLPVNLPGNYLRSSFQCAPASSSSSL